MTHIMTPEEIDTVVDLLAALVAGQPVTADAGRDFALFAAGAWRIGGRGAFIVGARGEP